MVIRNATLRVAGRLGLVQGAFPLPDDPRWKIHLSPSDACPGLAGFIHGAVQCMFIERGRTGVEPHTWRLSRTVRWPRQPRALNPRATR